jgi:hypothetical protein
MSDENWKYKGFNELCEEGVFNQNYKIEEGEMKLREEIKYVERRLEDL